MAFRPDQRPDCAWYDASVKHSMKFDWNGNVTEWRSIANVPRSTLATWWIEWAIKQLYFKMCRIKTRFARCVMLK